MLISIVYALTCSFLWATTAVVGSILAKTAVSPLMLAFLRYGTATVCLLPLLDITESRSISVHQMAPLMVLGLTVVLLFNGFYFSALQCTTPMSVSLIGATNPILTLVISALIFRHVPNTRQMIAFILALAGTVLVITQGKSVSGIFTTSSGEFLALGAVLSQIAYALTLKRMSGTFSPVLLSCATGVTGLIWLIPWIANQRFFEVFIKFSYVEWGLVLFIGSVCTALPIVLFSIAVHRIGPSITNLIIFSTMPLFVFIQAFLLLGHTASLWNVGGGVLVLSALFLGLKR